MNVNNIFPHASESTKEVLANLPALSWADIFQRHASFKQEGKCHSTSIISDRVGIGMGTEIGPFVVIEDNVLIGKNCVIRAGALIRSNTIIGDDCVIGHGAEIKHAFIFDQAKIQGNVFVGDSIIGKGARLGTGVVIGNRRFDQQEISWQTEDGLVASGSDKVGALIGDYARLGANVTTNPGTVIGAFTWIIGGQAIGGFIPARTFVKGKGELVENLHAKELSAVDKNGQY